MSVSSVPDLLAEHEAAEFEVHVARDRAAERSAAVLTLLRHISRHEPGPWRLRGTCRQCDPDLFYRRATMHAAMNVCRECPVMAECREWALALPDHEDHAGVAGGLAAAERHRRRAARVAPQ